MSEALQSARRMIANMFRTVEFTRLGRLLGLTLLVGAPTGVVAALFNFSITECSEWFLGDLGHYAAPLPGGEAAKAHETFGEARRWVLFWLPALGGLMCGWIVYKFAPEAEGHGTDHVIDSFHRQRGRIRGRVPLVKIISSAITIGSGGCAGREGPVAQVGAGLASNLANLLHLSDRERRVMLLAGAAAGIGAIFRAPLGAALFAVEVLYRESEFEYEALIPSFVASIVAYSVYCPLTGHGWGAIFDSGRHVFDNPLLLLFYFALALVVFAGGRIYVEVFYTVRNRIFRRIPVKPMFKPAIGGLILGVLALVFSFLTSPERMGAVYGAGYGYLQQAIDGRLTIGFLLLLALFKVIACSVTIGSGGSGGVFGPSIVIGGLLGGAFGLICHHFFPGTVGVASASAFALVGMAGFFAGVANVPVAALLMISEMTGGYALLTPLMLVVAVSYSLSRSGRSIYEKQVVARIDSPAHTGDFVTDVLEGIRVSEILRRETVDTVGEDMLLPEILAQAAESRQVCFPVTGEEGKLVGLVSLDTLRSAYNEPELAMLLIAGDIAEVDFEKIGAQETLNVALRRFVAGNLPELPVVDSDEPGRVIGMLNRRDIIVAYNQELQKQMMPA